MRLIRPVIGRLRELTRRHLDNRDGNVAILFSIVALPAMMAVGVVIDYTRMTTGQAVLQQAADSAAIAGMQSPTSTRNAVAASTLAGALGSSTLTNVTPTWTTNQDGSFTVGVSAKQRLILTFFGQPTGNLAVTATATNASSVNASASKVCILVLDPTATQALLVNSNVTLNSTNCEIAALIHEMRISRLANVA